MYSFRCTSVDRTLLLYMSDGTCFDVRKAAIKFSVVFSGFQLFVDLTSSADCHLFCLRNKRQLLISASMGE